VQGFIQRLVLPDSSGWNIIKENQVLSFQVKTTDPDPAFFALEGGEGLNISFDSLGNFQWQPSYDLIDRLTRMKDFTVIIEASWPGSTENKRIRETVTFVVSHVNRPPVVEELPVFYVKQSTSNSYQFPPEFVYDQDGDPIVFKSILAKMPEGAALTSQGQFTWNPSRSQFMAMRKEPLRINQKRQRPLAKSRSHLRSRICHPKYCWYRAYPAIPCSRSRKTSHSILRCMYRTLTGMMMSAMRDLYRTINAYPRRR
jgi:hypothetical protein